MECNVSIFHELLPFTATVNNYNQHTCIRSFMLSAIIHLSTDTPTSSFFAGKSEKDHKRPKLLCNRHACAVQTDAPLLAVVCFFPRARVHNGMPYAAKYATEDRPNSGSVWISSAISGQWSRRLRDHHFRQQRYAISDGGEGWNYGYLGLLVDNAAVDGSGGGNGRFYGEQKRRLEVDAWSRLIENPCYIVITDYSMYSRPLLKSL